MGYSLSSFSEAKQKSSLKSSFGYFKARIFVVCEDFHYIGCSRCFRKCENVCSTCKESEIQPLYLAVLHLEDDSGVIRVKAFNEIASRIFGQSAKELLSLKASNRSSFETLLSTLEAKSLFARMKFQTVESVSGEKELFVAFTLSYSLIIKIFIRFVEL